MKRLPDTIRLLIVFVVFLTGWLTADELFFSREILPYQEEMAEARDLAIEFFGITGTEKMQRGILSDAGSRVRYNELIGNDFSSITTTLGSLNAKEISTNPDFAALAVRLVRESGIPPGSTVGITLSGSFPAIGMSVLAALQTQEMKVIMMSSLGASSYGANQPGASWLDMESWLREKGALKYQSDIVTLGGEEEIGLGMLPEGVKLLRQTVEKNNYAYYTPKNLKESIDFKSMVFKEQNIALLINIGGNQASLGRCVHSSNIPTGLNKKLKRCQHEERGILQEMNEAGVPIIHFLNIRELALRYGIDTSPGIQYASSSKLYVNIKKNKLALGAFLVFGLAVFSLLFFWEGNAEL